MYTTISVVESILPVTSRRRRPVLSILSPVVAHQAHKKHLVHVHVHARRVYAHPAQLTRSNLHLRSCSVSSSREASQFILQPTALTFRTYRSTDSVQHLSQTTAEILAPPFECHTTTRIFLSILRPSNFFYSILYRGF